MLMYSKFQIFYQPNKNQRKRLESFSLSYYDFDMNTNTCKEKIVLEKNREKYKIKRECNEALKITETLEKLDLSKKAKHTVDLNDEVYCVKCGEQNYSTNNSEDIKELLMDLKFDELFAYMLVYSQQKGE